MIRTIMTVPKIAGNTPPSVFDSRGSLDTNSTTRARYRTTLAGRLIALGQPLLGPGRDGAAALANLLDRSDQEPPLRALHHHDVPGILPARDRAFVHPLEVGTVEVAIGDLELDAISTGAVRNRLALDQETGCRPAVREREAYDVARPEEAEAVGDDESQQAEHQHESERQCAARQPDEGLPAAPELPRPAAHR